MHQIFSTDRIHPDDRFQLWHGVCEERLVPMTHSLLSDDLFVASIEAVQVGGIALTRFRLGDVEASTTSRTIRHLDNKTDDLFLSLVLSGSLRARQYDRSSENGAGDFAVLDTNAPWTVRHEGRAEVLVAQLPRDRMEPLLGSARLFAGLTMDRHRPAATLARSLLLDLLGHTDTMSSATAERLSTVAVNLVTASIAERMAVGVPEELHDAIALQQAKAHVQAHLGDPDLDPSGIAAAVGIPPRRLHALFRAANGEDVATWIWTRRLEATERCLLDPVFAGVRLGRIARDCGFKSQTHFSRRFRERFGMSPRDYRDGTVERSGAR